MLLYRNATNDWMKSWYCLPGVYRKLGKLFHKETLSVTHTHFNKRMVYETRTSMQVHMSVLCILECRESQNFCENEFADFLDKV